MLNIKCLRCGTCREGVGISDGLNPMLVANHLYMDLYDFLDTYGFVIDVDSVKIECPASSMAPCSFLECRGEKTFSKIYPVRPRVCRVYPGPGILCEGGRKIELFRQ